MKERPILMSAPMVRARLAGTKTQTRREFKARNGGVWPNKNDRPGMRQIIRQCPYGQPGDRLWVREAWARTRIAQDASGTELTVYREGDSRTDYGGPWKPGIHMFRRDSRITLEVTGVRVERLQDISEADAISEGLIRCGEGWRGAELLPWFASPVGAYRSLWEQINGPGSWDANPWVWVVTFK